MDTSVIGGYLDAEFRDTTISMLDRIRKGEFRVVISNITKLELKGAPAGVHDFIAEIPDSYVEYVELTGEAGELAGEYISGGVLEKSKIVDAQHVSIATVHQVDIVVSWNFKHMVNINRIRGFNAVNLKMGYPVIDIRSPREVLSNEE